MKFLKNYAEQNHVSLYEALKLCVDDDLFKATKGKAFIALIERFSKEYPGQPVSEVLTSLLDQSGYETMLRTEGSQERLDNLAELKQSILDYEISCGEEADLEHYLAHIALFTNADLEMKQNSVKLMTVHTAKGLEFEHVFFNGNERRHVSNEKSQQSRVDGRGKAACLRSHDKSEKKLFSH